jgi:hypothetical protein
VDHHHPYIVFLHHPMMTPPLVMIQGMVAGDAPVLPGNDMPEVQANYQDHWLPHPFNTKQNYFMLQI